MWGVRGLATAAIIVATAVLLVGPAHAVGSEDNFGPPSSDYDRAVAAVKERDYRGAIRLLTGVLRDKPDHADALNWMGYSHRKLGDFTRAVAYYERALRIDPDHRGANEYLGEAWLELNQLARAEERLAHLARICGNCEEYRELKEAIEEYRAKQAAQQRSEAATPR